MAQLERIHKTGAGPKDGDRGDGDGGFDDSQRAQFDRDGYVVARRLVDPETVAELRSLVVDHEELRTEPVEFEADVHYPGAPRNRDAPGGDTPRRLLHAYRRHDRLKRWAHDPELILRLHQLLGDNELWLSQAHHNCIMTKCPAHSSDTGWHQDARYWSFSNRNLITAWLALGKEFRANGGLRVIPGSHLWTGLKDSDRLNLELFLRPEHADNVDAINDAVEIELDKGDVLFFHAGLFHSASRNHTDETKYSIVFTYHGARAVPEANTKSSRYPEIEL